MLFLCQMKKVKKKEKDRRQINRILRKVETEIKQVSEFEKEEII